MNRFLFSVFSVSCDRLKMLLFSFFFSFSIQAVTINDFSRHPEFYDVKILQNWGQPYLFVFFSFFD
ncbi:hypothetical protein [Shewanella septentrionalis]|uniref:Uncharacterized protein n=1 Tax=Shewanella septentrionalis TaxID=2952223 RepID=A0A9X2WRY0_9GAMM|nr:hypothetical protein [Shewanella septentrionalis]MCT7944258.1 hypothetical protein [Shewanella septentrionalis]